MKKNVNSFKIFFAKKIKNLSHVIYLAPKAAEKRALSQIYNVRKIFYLFGKKNLKTIDIFLHI